MSVNKSIKRIVRQFCAERNWIHDSQDKRQQIREKAAGLECGEAVELSDLAEKRRRNLRYSASTGEFQYGRDCTPDL